MLTPSSQPEAREGLRLPKRKTNIKKLMPCECLVFHEAPTVAFQLHHAALTQDSTSVTSLAPVLRLGRASRQGRAATTLPHCVAVHQVPQVFTSTIRPRITNCIYSSYPTPESVRDNSRLRLRALNFKRSPHITAFPRSSFRSSLRVARRETY